MTDNTMREACEKEIRRLGMPRQSEKKLMLFWESACKWQYQQGQGDPDDYQIVDGVICYRGEEISEEELLDTIKELCSTRPPTPASVPAAWIDQDGCLHATLESAEFRGGPVTPLYRHPPAPASVPEDYLREWLESAVLTMAKDTRANNIFTQDRDGSLLAAGFNNALDLIVGKAGYFPLPPIAAPAPAEPYKDGGSD